MTPEQLMQRIWDKTLTVASERDPALHVALLRLPPDRRERWLRACVQSEKACEQAKFMMSADFNALPNEEQRHHMGLLKAHMNMLVDDIQQTTALFGVSA